MLIRKDPHWGDPYDAADELHQACRVTDPTEDRITAAWDALDKAEAALAQLAPDHPSALAHR